MRWPEPGKSLDFDPSQAVTTTLPSIGLQCRIFDRKMSCICPICRNQGRKQLCLATGTNRSRHVEPPRPEMLDLACRIHRKMIDEQLERLTRRSHTRTTPLPRKRLPSFSAVQLATAETAHLSSFGENVLPTASVVQPRDLIFSFLLASSLCLMCLPFHDVGYFRCLLIAELT